MAEHLTVDAGRRLLRDGDLNGHTFDLLASIARLAARGETQGQARDLLIRTHEAADLVGRSFQPILQSLTATLGLFPYIDEPLQMSTQEQLAFESHRPPHLEGGDFVFHSAQREIYELLLAGDSVILSAPTSFGKSAIVDALVATGRWRTIVIIVPTLALIDETRRRLTRFSSSFKVVTFPAQEPGEQTLYVMTQERFLELQEVPPVDLFIIDEFYKLDGQNEESRTALLNIAWDRLRRTGAQYYLIGPSVDRLSDDLSAELRASLYVTNFRTVAVDEYSVDAEGDESERLINLCRGLDGSTMIYCKSPKRAREVASWLLEAGLGTPNPGVTLAADWIAQSYDPEWILARCVRQGIGLHHGRVPRSLQHHMIRHFNAGQLRFLVCTSTLIEGVNTAAQNVVVFDGKLSNKRLDYFTFNNIRGRAGRMSHHYVGKVFLFQQSPSQEENVVDIPITSQSEKASLSAIVQLPEQELSSRSRERMRGVWGQSALSLKTIAENKGISPLRQIALAEELRSRPAYYHPLLAWTGVPTYDQRVAVSDLILKHLTEAGQRGRVTAKSLAYRLELARRNAGDIAQMIRGQANFGKADHDEATEDVLFFLRNWLGHLMPSLLGVLERVQRDVFESIGNPAGNYGFYASQVESLFLPNFFATLEEYGLPVQVAVKLRPFGLSGDTLDEVLLSLRRVAADPRLPSILHPYEAEMLNDVVVGLGLPQMA